MIILPAIDLMSGQVVRLKQGKAEDKTVYSDDPASMALKWQNEGAEYMHLVDLDGAFEGESKNLSAIRSICKELAIPCELGGGIRKMKDMEVLYDAGVSRAIIGSKAVENPQFVKEAVEAFGCERVAVGIDARDGKVATKGWTEVSQVDAIELARRMEGYGVGTIIYTDIATDGMLQGPNIEALEEMNEAVDIDLVASGGVTTASDIQRLNQIKGLYGAIVGKALYENKINLEECLSITR
ncbi:MAG: 1-(5-phosphoribosyl)-5-[(5-phosphoribosylamino)methylideneamino]imidazole-4-carboxamide isomerase [Verrucomicrobiota bacterium]